ncbi:unnamed protein product [Strongylus vulgaris]|uniref:Uncharacterized protein n=1 Tax=Strongylus vulgaris TaxID=40348 RepID=A0A3P7JB23_STRVU|nr:unnamed protein product [Strongylus vulgaris]
MSGVVGTSGISPGYGTFPEDMKRGHIRRRQRQVRFI